MADLPPNVRIREVGPRDGFQNEPEVIPTSEKVRLIGMLAATGRPRGVAYSVLIPNQRGLERALAHRERFDEVNLFLSASETHNRENVNRSIAESLRGLERVLGRARGEGLRCEGVISVAFGCPYEGRVPPDRVH